MATRPHEQVRLNRLSSSHSSKRSSRRMILEPESLEGRALLTAITDMTQLAALFPPRTTPTKLFLAFDGYTLGNEVVAPYEGSTAPNGRDPAVVRDQDIQEILFQTQEHFAPFNVQVLRAPTSATSEMLTGGATTVLVGDTTTLFVKAGAETPAAFYDTLFGEFVQPNSHACDFAFVDPTNDFDRSKDKSLNWIVSVIAHEAGHTLGLAHVRTRGADPAALASNSGDPNLPDIMSYDSPQRRFLNETLLITGANYDAATDTSPIDLMNYPWYRGDSSESSPIFLMTQNSFTYLQTVVGVRVADDFGGVVHREFVDSSFAIGALAQVDLNPWSGTIGTTGDYDAFRFKTSPLSGTFEYLVSATVKASSGSALDPVLLVYRNEKDLVSFNNDRSSTDRSASVVVNAQSPDELQFVVGAADGKSTGTYTLTSQAFATLDRGTGVLTVLGTSGDDTIRVSFDGHDYTIRVNDSVGTIHYAGRPNVKLNGGTGNDSVVLDLGAGVGTNYNLTADGLNRSLPTSLPSATFERIEHVELVGSGGIDDVRVEGLPVDVKDLQIRTLGGSDKVALASFASTQIVRVDTGTGVDWVAAGLEALGSLDVGGGFDTDLDTLAIDDRGYDASTSYQLQSTRVSRSDGTSVSFHDIDKVSILAGRGIDILTVTTYPTATAIHFDGGSDLDTLQASDVANNWMIDANDGGKLNDKLTFASVENLLGGADIDWFSLIGGKGVSGTVKGGSGDDLLNYSVYDAPVVFDLQASTATGTGGFASIENVTGSSGFDVVKGARASSDWTLIGTNAGRVEWTEALGQFLIGRRLNFSGIEELAGADPGQSKGLIDQLRATNVTNTWTVSGTNVGSLNGLKFSGMEALIGGTGRDDYVLGVRAESRGQSRAAPGPMR
ncbi:MAG: hypothetical protein U0794_02215 [Isosphaeraceae bacterium]